MCDVPDSVILPRTGRNWMLLVVFTDVRPPSSVEPRIVSGWTIERRDVGPPMSVRLLRERRVNSQSRAGV